MNLRDLILRIANFETAIIDGQQPEALITHEELSLQAKDKIDAYGFVMERLDALATSYKQRAGNLSKIAKRLEDSQEQLRTQLLDAMQILGVDEIEGNERRFRMQASKPKVELTEPDRVPEKFWKTEIVKWLDKDAVLKHGNVPGCEIVQNKHIREYPAKGK